MAETTAIIEKKETVWKTKFDGFGEFLGYYPLWRRRSRKRSALVILVRHGRSILNEYKRLQPWTPEGDLLSPTGRIQSQLLARILRFIDLDDIYASDFQRAENTARIIMAQQRQPGRIRLRIDSGLRDFNFGQLSGLSMAEEHNEVAERFPEIYDLYLNHRDQFYAPDGDRLSDYASHASARAEEIARDHIGRVVLMASHEAWIKAPIYWTWKRPLSDFNAVKIRNASISILEYHKSTRGFEVLVVNDASHLT